MNKMMKGLNMLAPLLCAMPTKTTQLRTMLRKTSLHTKKTNRLLKQGDEHVWIGCYEKDDSQDLMNSLEIYFSHVTGCSVLVVTVGIRKCATARFRMFIMQTCSFSSVVPTTSYYVAFLLQA